MVGFVLLGILVMIVLFVMEMASYDDLKYAKENVKNHYKNCKFSLFNKDGSQYLLLTENNKVVFAKNNKAIEIPIDDILKVDLKYNVMEKHKQNVLTVMPSFNATTSLLNVELNIFTFSDNDISHKFYPDSYPNMGNKLEKFKYLIEDLKSKNTNN